MLCKNSVAGALLQIPWGVHCTFLLWHSDSIVMFPSFFFAFQNIMCLWQMLQSFIYHCTPFPLQCFVVCDCWRKRAFLFTNTLITLYFTTINPLRFFLIHMLLFSLLCILLPSTTIFIVFSPSSVLPASVIIFTAVFFPIISPIAWKMTLFTNPYSNWLVLKASLNISP